MPNTRDEQKLADQCTLFQLDPVDFPLVCSFEQFLSLLQNTVRALDRKKPRERPTRSPSNLVDFKTFRHRYWYRLPQDLTKQVSPHSAFSDIMGVIKGSVHSCKTLKPLDLEAYQDLSTRVAPNITSVHSRAKVYQIFERYEKLKLEAGDLDTIDWVTSLLKDLRGNPHIRSYLASYLDEMYVDEVQDQRCVDIALMLELGNDPRCFHFGGDTAQGISQDSVFRFQDVKELFHNHFLRQTATVGQQHLAQPQLFTLNRNYRSHQGILSMASAVMGLLWRSFPDTVDKLEPEVGTLIGPVPILFLECDTSILINRDTEDTSLPQHELLFGAEQVILVRDDSMKAELVDKIGEVALVLTILQAKGMEFDDVILWDFLSTTPDRAGWRSLQDSVGDEPSAFDAAKHSTLCSELKHLYVAITRARVRFLMIESSGDAAGPFTKLMTQKSPLALLEVTCVGAADFDEKVKALQPRRSDDPHRWLVNGKDMMSKGSFQDACYCFRRARAPLKAKEAVAFLDEVQGEKYEAQGRMAESRAAFDGAALAFRELGLVKHAVRLLLRLKRSEDAAELWCADGKFEQAALIFEDVSNHKRAAEAWYSAHKFNNAILCLRNGALYDQMVLYLAEVQDRLSDLERRQHQLAVKILIKQKKISPDCCKTAIRLVGSAAEQEAYYLDFEMNEDLLQLYTQQQATLKLFNLLVKLDRLEEALSLGSSLPNEDDAFSGRYVTPALLLFLDLILKLQEGSAQGTPFCSSALIRE